MSNNSVPWNKKREKTMGQEVIITKEWQVELLHKRLVYLWTSFDDVMTALFWVFFLFRWYLNSTYKQDHQTQCSQFEKKTNQRQFLFEEQKNTVNGAVVTSLWCHQKTFINRQALILHPKIWWQKSPEQSIFDPRLFLGHGQWKFLSFTIIFFCEGPF